MGLKHFHILFIILSVFITLAFGLWALFAPSDVINGWGRVGGAFSTLLGAGLVFYGIWFLKKSSRIIT